MTETVNVAEASTAGSKKILVRRAVIPFEDNRAQEWALWIVSILELQERPFLAAVLVAVILIAGCAPASSMQDIFLRGPDDQLIGVKAEIADEPAEHARGLMGRSALAEGQGMLFLFDREEVRSFWMKDTLVPLDVLFFDITGKLISTRTMVPCDADPCHSYSSGAPAASALEMPAGFVAENRIGPGWTMHDAMDN